MLSACGAGSLGPGFGASPVTLQSIQIGPSASSIVVGEKEQLTATGHYSDGSTKDITNSTLWASSNTGVVTISSSGLATAHSTGSAIISASLSGIVGQGSITVTSATLVSIAISPLSVSIASGDTVQFSAVGTFSDGTHQDITSSVSWASGNLTVASINEGGVAGLAKGLSPGVSIISATSGHISSTATLTVTNAILVSIAVTPADAVLLLGTLQQYTATGTFSDGSVQDITGTVTWASSNNSVVSVASGGAATARARGSVTISATSGSVVGSTTASVQPATLSFITLRPANKQIAKLTSQQFQAIGTYTDGSTHNLTGQVLWTSSNTAVAKIGNRGLAKALAPGTTTISATLGSISGSTKLEVTNATIVSISVTPSGDTVAAGTKLPFIAKGLFSDNTIQVITRDCAWASDDPAVVTVAAAGVATAIAPGTANVVATFGGVSGSAVLHVSAAMLSSISVTPASALLAPTTSVNCIATGLFSDGSTQVITNLVTWTSSAPQVASVSPGGKVTAQSGGSATIIAQLGSVSGDSAITVDASPLTSIQITPPVATVPQQGEVAFVATGTFADGKTQDLTTSVLWTSSPASVASISNIPGTMGLATGLEPGSATITALFDGQVGTASLTVSSATPTPGANSTSGAVSPAVANLEQGGCAKFSVGDYCDAMTK